MPIKWSLRNTASSAIPILYTKRLSNCRGVNIVAKNVVPAKSEVTFKTRWEKVKQYFINVYKELKKVHWPNRTQLIGYTGVVLISVAIVALIIWLFDKGLSFVLEKLFNAFA